MSLILEALRKSEAERRRGEAPDLRVELPPVAPPGRPVVPAWAWIAGVAVVLLAALALLWPSGAGSDADDSAGTDTTGNEAVVTQPSAGLGARPGSGTAAGDGDDFPRVDRIEPPLPPAATVAAGEPASSARPVPLPPTEAVAAAAADPSPVLPPVPQAGAGAGQVTPEVPAAALTRSGPGPGANVPRITELASAQRQRLPAMKLSMHMWNEDPARRFVVIDGQRKVEGDRVGEASIAAIDREGVLLDLDGSQVRVPLP